LLPRLFARGLHIKRNGRAGAVAMTNPSPEYREIALARIAHADSDLDARQQSLFDEIDKPAETVEHATQEQLGLFGD
jgi:hypothetical protein